MRWLYMGALALFGLWLFVGGLWSSSKRLTLRRKGVRVRGSVVDVTSRSSRSSLYYYPVIEFHAGGEKRRFEGPSSSSAPEKGAPVDVVYDPDDPANAVVAGNEETLSGPLAASALGLLILSLLLGCWLLIRSFELEGPPPPPPFPTSPR
jgi:hypothetical protein